MRPKSGETGKPCKHSRKTNRDCRQKTQMTLQNHATQRFLNTSQVLLKDIGGLDAILTGVQPYGQEITEYYGTKSDLSFLREKAQVHSLVIAPGEIAGASYIIEWIENIPLSPFVWPDTIKMREETKTTYSIAEENDGIVLQNSRAPTNSTRNAAKLIVGSQTLYVCALTKKVEGSTGLTPGCIVYAGTPDQSTRKKIRVALSFALGVYLVELGHTVYNSDWKFLSATSLSAYSLAKRTFDPGPQPIAYLSQRGWQHELDRALLNRLVNALVENYNKLDLGHLSWAYWHACASTVHVAPAQFGAAIEALLRAFNSSNPGKIRTTVLPRPEWKILRGSLAAVVDAANISDDQRRLLTVNLPKLNETSIRSRLADLATVLEIQIGDVEWKAWQRRNAAAHGIPTQDDDVLSSIRDMKLLRTLFDRLLLKITGAADWYIDYASPNHPPRILADPVPF